MGRVCDGNPDCPLGDDEKSCVALAENLEDNEIIPYNEEGKEPPSNSTATPFQEHGFRLRRYKTKLELFLGGYIWSHHIAHRYGSILFYHLKRSLTKVRKRADVQPVPTRQKRQDDRT